MNPAEPVAVRRGRQAFGLQEYRAEKLDVSVTAFRGDLLNGLFAAEQFTAGAVHAEQMNVLPEGAVHMAVELAGKVIPGISQDEGKAVPVQLFKTVEADIFQHPVHTL